MAGRIEIDSNILKNKADYIRKKVIDVAIRNEAGHIAPSLSCIDILTVLYYHFMNIPPDSQEWEKRDRLLLSKAHGSYGLYAILNDLGFIPEIEWENFYKDSTLKGCVEKNEKYGIEASCGSLGHGLPMATGIAFGAKLQNEKYKTFCIVGDGEMQEGSMWEAVQFAAKYRLSNLTVIVDNNGLQAMDYLENVLTIPDDDNELERKFSAFGFESITCDGHNIDNLISTLNHLNNSDSNKPKALIAKTVKGYGLLCMENIPKFHYRLPTQEELNMGNRYE